MAQPSVVYYWLLICKEVGEAIRVGSGWWVYIGVNVERRNRDGSVNLVLARLYIKPLVLYICLAGPELTTRADFQEKKRTF